MPTAKVNGVNLYYEVSGEQGDPVLLVHGSWGDHTNWDAAVPGLSKNFRVVTYDRRGHSKSEKITTQGSFDEDAEDASALLSHLGFNPAHIVGNSGGSTIALKLATRDPSVFRSLIAHEPPLLDLALGNSSLEVKSMEGRRRARKVASLLEAGDMAGGAKLFVETISFGPGQWDRMPASVKEIFVSNADTFLDESRDREGLTVDLKALSGFQKPTLLTNGGKSAPFFKPIVEKLAKTIPGSKLEQYPNDGHTPHASNPDEFVKRVTAFITSLK